MPRRKMMMRAYSLKAAACLALLLLSVTVVPAQESDSVPVHRKRLNTLLIGGGATYGITLVGLNELWYKGNGREAFHFFNDNAEWKQVDKIGHFYSSFYLT